MNLSKEAKDANSTKTIPKSSCIQLFDKLDAFLPRLQYANEELQQKIASDGAEKYSLDLHDSEQEDGNSDPDAKTKPTVEMNFALGLMANDPHDAECNSSDSDSTDDQESPRITLSVNEDARLPALRVPAVEKQACSQIERSQLIKEIN
uniref:AlNc14C28G2726 protein n=1 Tax=Albugo laibachii Nc14 TaxID=890382 RepID=F0W7A4_9STRA|nr:AlNc14C28G2726 [Albugo laibachii Nc14]|eukprot:CCA17003.1 AlNc14C28G2726 [Albugo laibachii Nc14]